MNGEWVCYTCVGTQYAELEVGRAAYEEGTNQGRQWAPSEDKYLREHYETMGFSEIAHHLDRTHSGVRGRHATLKLGKKPYITSVCSDCEAEGWRP